MFLALAGCSKNKTERQLYEDETSGFIYTTYKTSSLVTVGAMVKVYNVQRPDSIPAIRPEYAHALLGYMWAVAGKPVMAFAEASILEGNPDEEMQFLASSLRSITMYQHGWNALAKQEADRGNGLLKRSSSSNIKTEATVFYLLVAIAKMQEGKFDEAKLYWAGFATQTGIDWPYALTDAAADLRGGQPQRGLQKLKVISQDPAVPEPLRVELAARLTTLEAHTGNVNSPLFWPNLISAAVLAELKRTNNEGIGKLVKMVEDVKKKLS
ncbi:hypothetical protein GCM10022409_24630 [Hymenobacter glaciei]|uniref:Uncharacterized protein n=2 Tax=Hymenobacter glaciei TaxID=877209 RepID=A0ABP7U978_9BACT